MSEHLTTNLGALAGNKEYGGMAGQRGAMMAEDGHPVEHQGGLRGERALDRAGPARSAGARGVFVTEHSMAAYTKAHFVQQEGQETPVLVRFSPFTLGQGSPETARDLRSFAVKFHTQEGCYDIVGHHLPVFFIRDAVKYEGLMHALKPLQDAKQRELHYWDFMTQTTESTHMLTWLFSNAGTPANYRQMNGYSIHAFIWINAEGVRTYVKYHWRSKQGVVNFTHPEAAEMQTRDFSHATRDLYASIELHSFPQWELHVQLMTPEAGAALPFHPLDPTRTWPEDRFPLVKVGTMTLNQNPVNYFLEVEQSAFSASALVPGIEPSEDALLHGLLFADRDAERYRSGAARSGNAHSVAAHSGASHLNIPVNCPKALVRYRRQAADQANASDEAHGDAASPQQAPADAGIRALDDAASRDSADAGIRALDDADSRDPAQGFALHGASAAADDFAQAGERYRMLPEEEREWLIRNLAGELRQIPQSMQLRAVCSFGRADVQFGERLAAELGIHRS